MTRKSVCIVGAGPAGLVAAKTLLQTKRFDVTIYEKADRIGGIWALDEQSRHGFLSPQTPTNLSRFTVGFSDLAWTSVNVHSEAGKGELPIFPRAWQVNRYLEEYRRRYVPKRCLHLGAKVVAVHHDQHEWVVSSERQGDREERRYDHVVMASGFFAQPRPIEQNVPHVQAGKLKIVHSSDFRTLTDLFPDQVTSKIILIIGGGNSAGEAAGVVAGQLSSAQNSPDLALRERYRGVRILHIIPRSLYALPPFLPADDSGCFVPLDFSFYDLVKRPTPVVAAAGISSQEVREMLHSGIQRSIGNDQADLGSAALIAPVGDRRGAVQVALSETYVEFVRSGLIEVLRGRVVSVAGDSKAQGTAVVEHDDTQHEIGDIGAVLYATGYSPIPALDLIDEQTKQQLSFDRDSMRLPLILEQWQTMNEAVPSIAFHGFYEGPYWGVMEMQARLTASRWLDAATIRPNAYEARQSLLDLRNAMHEKHADVPQYWLGDYGGYMEEMAAALKLKRNDGSLKSNEGPVSPARYLDTGDDQQEANATMQDLASTLRACLAGKYTARAAFRALQGRWTMSRTISSQNSVLPSGIVQGTATFHLRAPSSEDFDAEYLYVEEGTFKTETGVEMSVSRSYVYRYCEASDQLSVWFLKPNAPFEVDYLFHDLSFAQEQSTWLATADHLCVADMYRTEYRLTMSGILLSAFQVRHVVEGPQKSYVAETTYTRPPLS